jgi:hypothetical protein
VIHKASINDDHERPVLILMNGNKYRFYLTHQCLC